MTLRRYTEVIDPSYIWFVFLIYYTLESLEEGEKEWVLKLLKSPEKLSLLMRFSVNLMKNETINCSFVERRNAAYAIDHISDFMRKVYIAMRLIHLDWIFVEQNESQLTEIVPYCSAFARNGIFPFGEPFSSWKDPQTSNPIGKMVQRERRFSVALKEVFSDYPQVVDTYLLSMAKLSGKHWGKKRNNSIAIFSLNMNLESAFEEFLKIKLSQNHPEILEYFDKIQGWMMRKLFDKSESQYKKHKEKEAWENSYRKKVLDAIREEGYGFIGEFWTYFFKHCKDKENEGFLKSVLGQSYSGDLHDKEEDLNIFVGGNVAQPLHTLKENVLREDENLMKDLVHMAITQNPESDYSWIFQLASNASEAGASKMKWFIRIISYEGRSVLEVTVEDDGRGLTNWEPLLTPFYTKKVRTGHPNMGVGFFQVLFDATSVDMCSKGRAYCLERRHEYDPIREVVDISQWAVRRKVQGFYIRLILEKEDPAVEQFYIYKKICQAARYFENNMTFYLENVECQPLRMNESLCLKEENALLHFIDAPSEVHLGDIYLNRQSLESLQRLSLYQEKTRNNLERLFFPLQNEMRKEVSLHIQLNTFARRASNGSSLIWLPQAREKLSLAVTVAQIRNILTILHKSRDRMAATFSLWQSVQKDPALPVCVEKEDVWRSIFNKIETSLFQKGGCDLFLTEEEKDVLLQDIDPDTFFALLPVYGQQENFLTLRRKKIDQKESDFREPMKTLLSLRESLSISVAC